MAFEDESRAAIAAVLQGCRLCREVQQSLISRNSISKRDKSPVTVADFGVQAVVNHHLKTIFPEIPIVGEEDTGYLHQPENLTIKDQVIEYVLRIIPELGEAEILTAIDQGTHEGGSSGKFWCLDPVDGTKGFLRGDQYAIALALIEGGEVLLGILGCPELPLSLRRADETRGCIFYAIRDEGAFMARLDAVDEMREIRVDMISDPAWAKFCESVEAEHSSHDDARRIADLLDVQAPPVRIDSQCKYAVVARGDASIYLRLPTEGIGRKNPDRYVEKIWDHAAGSILIEEAGGAVTDIHGRKLDFSRGRKLTRNEGVIVTNGILHESVLRAVQEVMGSESA